jgi:hypothetical protein
MTNAQLEKAIDSEKQSVTDIKNQITSTTEKNAKLKGELEERLKKLEADHDTQKGEIKKMGEEVNLMII